MADTIKSTNISSNGVVTGVMLETRRAERKICLNGAVAIVALLALYGISCIVPQSWQVYTADFSSFFVVLALSAAVSALWLATYWFLDRLQRESVRAVVSTFAYSLVVYGACSLLVTWIVGTPGNVDVESVLLPTAVFYIVFLSYVVKLRSFDELVDSFIYGGFIGTGIACASCIIDFTRYESMSVQFLLFALSTRISVHAAVCALGGFLFHRSLLAGKKVRFCIALIALLLLFGAEYIIESLVAESLAYAAVEWIFVLIALGFVLVTIGIVVIFIHVTLRKEESRTVSLERIHAPVVVSAVVAALFLLCTCYARYDLLRTTAFVSEDGAWRFSLPSGFVQRQELVQNSIFLFDFVPGNTYYEKEGIQFYVDFDSERMGLAGNTAPFSPQRGWNIEEKQTAFIEKDDNGTARVRYQYTYLLEKDDHSILVDVYAPTNEVKTVRQIVRTFTKSVQEKI